MSQTNDGLVRTGLKAIAEVLQEKNIAPAKLATTFETVLGWTSTLETLTNMIKTRIRQTVLERGTKVTDKGSMSLQDGGLELSIQPVRTGYDPKQVEALLRARHIEPSRYMGMKVTYEIDESKLMRSVEEHMLTADELEACRYQLSYKVMSPKRVTEPVSEYKSIGHGGDYE